MVLIVYVYAVIRSQDDDPYYACQDDEEQEDESLNADSTVASAASATSPADALKELRKKEAKANKLFHGKSDGGGWKYKVPGFEWIEPDGPDGKARIECLRCKVQPFSSGCDCFVLFFSFSFKTCS